MKSSTLCGSLLLTVLVTLGCNGEQAERTQFQQPDTLGVTQPVTTAPAAGMTSDAAATVDMEMINREGQRIGTARLTQENGGVRIALQASNLPAGPKGYHFHETGRCDTPSFESAGDHFAPMGRQHGLQNPQGPHAGDMPNLPIRQNGTVDTVLVNPRVTLQTGVPNSLFDGDGTALVIHAGEDDQRTDPSGNSGDRIACGVVDRARATGL
ncbi:MAG: superoxide dismutase family protein [Gemmatimonadetes bacterium]|nr:superoxide dismutase family protein [Gemmatimonadota bacterium]